MNRFHDYIEKCPYCGKFMTAEQVEHHICNSPLIDIKEVPILYYFMQHKENGDTVISARGLDGVLYKLRQSQTSFIRRRFTRDESDKDLTEP